MIGVARAVRAETGEVGRMGTGVRGGVERKGVEKMGLTGLDMVSMTGEVDEMISRFLSQVRIR